MKTKKISKDEALKLLGLFVLGAEYYAKGSEVEKAMCKALKKINQNFDDTYAGNISDAMVSGASATDFYTALEREGFTVLGKPS